MTYNQRFYFRFFKKYQRTLNGLKGWVCRRTCRDYVYVMRILNAASNLS